MKVRATSKQLNLTVGGGFPGLNRGQGIEGAKRRTDGRIGGIGKRGSALKTPVVGSNSRTGQATAPGGASPGGDSREPLAPKEAARKYCKLVGDGAAAARGDLRRTPTLGE